MKNKEDIPQPSPKTILFPALQSRAKVKKWFDDRSGEAKLALLFFLYLTGKREEISGLAEEIVDEYEPGAAIAVDINGGDLDALRASLEKVGREYSGHRRDKI